MEMRRFAMVVVMSVLLAFSAFAGEIPSTDFKPPTPPTGSSTSHEGDMGSGGFAQEITDEVVLAIFGFFAG